MEGKEAIIDKILSDANAKAEQIESDAKNKAKEMVDSAKEWAEKFTDTQNAILEKELEEIVKRRITNANLDVRKDLLMAKHSVLEQTFDRAYKALCSLNKEQYLNFVKKLIIENAEKGDEIILSKDGVISANDFGEQFLKENGLSIKKEIGKFVGGVVLSNKVCDKDLTFRSVIDSKKEQLIGKVAEMLF